MAGLDSARPWGLVVEVDGQEFSAYGFVPVTDFLPGMLVRISYLLGPAQSFASWNIVPPVAGADTLVNPTEFWTYL